MVVAVCWLLELANVLLVAGAESDQNPPMLPNISLANEVFPPNPEIDPLPPPPPPPFSPPPPLLRRESKLFSIAAEVLEDCRDFLVDNAWWEVGGGGEEEVWDEAPLGAILEWLGEWELWSLPEEEGEEGEGEEGEGPLR